MRRDANKLSRQIAESEEIINSFNSVIKHPPPPPPPSRENTISSKIAKLNKKIRKTRNKRTKQNLISKREALRAELNWGPYQLNEAFNGAYRSYRIDGIRGIDPGTFLDKGIVIFYLRGGGGEKGKRFCGKYLIPFLKLTKLCASPRNLP